VPDDPTDVPAEAAVVLQLTGRVAALSREQLLEALDDISPERVDAALDRLAKVDVVRLTARSVHAGACLRRIDALGLICV
jgi:hypothetical protein